MKKYLLLLVILLSTLITANANPNSDGILKKSKVDFFIENKGQWDPQVKFLAKIGGMNAWITDFGIVYDFYKIEYDEDLNIDSLRKTEPYDWMEKRYENARRVGQVVKMSFIECGKRLGNSNNNLYEVQGKDKLETYYNYFISNDSTKWASYIGLFKEVIIKNVYEGIDYRLYFENGMLRYDLNIQPYADLEQIRMKYEGQEGLEVNENGELVIKTSIGDVKNQEIYAYQNSHPATKETEIPVRFIQNIDGTIGYSTKNYDNSLALIIDPLIYSTFIGGSNEDVGQDITIDSTGEAYVTGYTISTDYPTTNGAYDVSYNYGPRDVFVTKLNANGSSLIYSTFIGGTSPERDAHIATDGTGDAYVTGWTGSPDYPTTSGAFDESYNGGGDVFVTKLNANGSSLIYSIFIGGDTNDISYDIEVDDTGAAYVTGTTESPDYPTTSGAFDENFNSGNNDIFITKLNASGSSLMYSTFIGGNSHDIAYDIAIDNTGAAYVTGWTGSPDYPTTSGAFDQSYNDGWDVFITKLDTNGSSLIYSTFIGGEWREQADCITIDSTGAAYVTGSTLSPDYPTTSGAYDESYNSKEISLTDVFVTKLDASGSFLIFSTFIGGTRNNEGYGIAIDDTCAVYVTGYTTSSDFPTTGGCFDDSFNGSMPIFADVFISKLNPSGSSLLYSTFVGGASIDIVRDIALDSTGAAYVTGQTSSSDYPTTSGAYDESFNAGRDDVFITMLSLPLTLVETDSVTPNSYCVGSLISIPFAITGTYYPGNVFTAQLSDSSGNFSSPENIGILSDTSQGTIIAVIPFDISEGSGYRVRVVSSNPKVTGSDNGTDITINSLPVPQITDTPTPVCSGNLYTYTGNNSDDVTNKWESYGGTIDGSDNGATVNIIWDSGSSGTVTLVQTITATGCKDSVSQIITINGSPNADILGNNEVCQGSTEYYQTNNLVNVTNSWSVVNGAINSLATADTIEVVWGSAGTGTVILIKTDTITSCADTVVKEVIINPTPIVTFVSPIEKLCLSDEGIVLSGGYPVDGIYSGKDVINDWFDPIEEGDYEITYTYTNDEGCSNSAKDTIKVLPNPEKPTITRDKRKLISSDAISYQWYVDSTLIPSATGKEYTPTKIGYYHVEVTDENGCRSISDEFYYGSIGVKEKQEKENILIIKPNPFSETTSLILNLKESGFVSLVITNLIGINIIEIYNYKYMESGQHIFQFNANSLPDGVYNCTLRIGNHVENVKMVVVR